MGGGGGGVQPCKLIRTGGHTNWKYLVPSPKAVRYARSALKISRRRRVHYIILILLLLLLLLYIIWIFDSRCTRCSISPSAVWQYITYIYARPSRRKYVYINPGCAFKYIHYIIPHYNIISRARMLTPWKCPKYFKKTLIKLLKLIFKLM